MKKLLLISFSAVLFSCGQEKEYDCPKDYCGMRVVDFGAVGYDYTLEKSFGGYVNVDFPYADQKYFIGDTIGNPTASEKYHLYLDNLQKQLDNIK